MDNNFLSGILAKLQYGMLNRPAQAAPNALPTGGILANLQPPQPFKPMPYPTTPETAEMAKWEALQDMFDQARNPVGSHAWPRAYTPEQLQQLAPLRK